ncbi:MAG: hypothetical protein QOJ65_2499 [Fimbriimonadaceae bacterium]|jgi:uncharacterized damage-inducible protein DinB|nr:hypothetical protein [Fimbriimonadaceae bacterium]
MSTIAGEIGIRLQDHIVDTTRAAAKDPFRYAKALPADKLDWKPMDEGRSALDICRELAMCPTWAYQIVQGDKQPEWNEDAMAAMKKEQEGWTTVEACEAECNKRLEKLFELYKSMPDERLKETKWLPYDGGRDFTMPEMMDYPRWNFTYHLGQIAYIQTLLGDREMH